MKTRIFLPLSLVAAFASCKTSSDQAALKDEPTAIGLRESLPLAKDEAQALYLQMIAVELNAGVKVPKEQLHATRGVVQCRRDTEPQTCQVLVRLPDDALGAPQPLAASLVEKFGVFVERTRAELLKEKTFLMDLSCDYLGKKSPPYEIEDINCNAYAPRLPREAVIDEPFAIELTDDLRGEVAVGAKLATLVGTLACRFAEGSNRPSCMVRAMKNGILTERVLEVSPKNAPTIARMMREAAFDMKAVAGDTGSKTTPKELTGALVCVIDASQAGVDGAGARAYQCRVTL